MAKKDDFLGTEITNALKKMSRFAQSASVAPLADVPAAPPREDDAGNDDETLLVWYRAMKPHTMCKLLWMVLLQCQARRSRGRIHFEEFAALLGVKKEKVAQALRDLNKLGWIEIAATERGPRRSIVSRTIVVKTSSRKQFAL